MTSDRPPLRPPLVIIAGPTAVGKTSLSIRLAKKFGAEIINADSRQIYKKLDIGTAKPTKEEQSEVPHHLVDLINPDEHFNAARFAELARSKIVEINQRGKRVFVVGGTGLYIKALVHGLFPAPPSDKTTKEQLVKEAEIYGLSFLYEKLKKVDPV
ncbi:MAG: tRNA (adenosine(37)-N6)-dimethylallyltransferase MiaA, partial [Deltaproteobacteria bacterium]